MGLLPPTDLDVRNGSVIATKLIPKGTQYGPVGNFLAEYSRRCAREVSEQINP